MIADSRLPIADSGRVQGSAIFACVLFNVKQGCSLWVFKSIIGNRQSAILSGGSLHSAWQSDAEEIASALLFDLGSTGIVTLNENLDCVTLGAYFDQTKNTELIKQTVESEFERAGRSDELTGVSISEVPNQDWMQKWKEGFEAIEVGERLVVAPSWKIPANRDTREVIQIDPGMAFGTGTHETTRLCLEAIDRHWRGGSLLDVGTGTGILAIAAALLAPGSRVVAIDVDPLAVEVARENLAINNVSNAVELQVGQPGDLAAQKFEMVVANLTAEVIIDLSGGSYWLRRFRRSDDIVRNPQRACDRC